MSWFEADVTPIANSIRNFGSGLVSNALSKAKLDRQLARDMVDFDYKQARTAREQQDFDNIERFSSMFDPTAYSRQELSNIGANVAAGRNVVNDALTGAQAAQRTRMQRELYESGPAATRVSIALGKGVMPYRLNGKTGAVINQMTGEVVASPEGIAAARATGGSGLDANDILPYYRRMQSVPDIISGVERKSNYYDTDAMYRDLAALQAAGVPITRETVLSQILKGASGNAAAPSPANAEPAEVAPTVRERVKSIVGDPSLIGDVEQLGQALSEGRITRAQFIQELKRMGVN